MLKDLGTAWPLIAVIGGLFIAWVFMLVISENFGIFRYKFKKMLRRFLIFIIRIEAKRRDKKRAGYYIILARKNGKDYNKEFFKYISNSQEFMHHPTRLNTSKK